MANQVAARLSGDDYQHLVAWLQILELRMPGRRVLRVIVEDPEAGSVDDVTTLRELGAKSPNEFVQIKYHVDHRGEYSTAVLLQKKTLAGTSLLQKFYATWQKLTQKDPDRPVELRLMSNWTWEASDPVKRCIEGKDNSLSEEFFSSGTTTKCGAAREQWREHLGIDPDEFMAFARTLRFRLGYDCADELEARVSERMMFLGLKCDATSLLVGVGIVRELIKAQSTALDKEAVEALLLRYDLFAAADESATVIYLSTVKQQQFELPPDFLLDWREYFEGDASKRSHRVLDATSWNDRMLPELLELEADLNTRNAPRLIRARGLARLSAWFAFGHTFSDVARFTIEVDQQGNLWRTDASPSDLVAIERGRETVDGGDSSTVAIGISVTGSLDDEVWKYLVEHKTAVAVLSIGPSREIGRDCFRTASDVTAFTQSAKERMRSFVKEHNATRLLLFYFGPLSGACFLGHQLNAVAREIQVMEDQQPGYAPAFLLT